MHNTAAVLLSVNTRQRAFNESETQRHSRTAGQQLSSLACDYANPQGPPPSPGDVTPVKELLQLPRLELAPRAPSDLGAKWGP